MSYSSVSRNYTRRVILIFTVLSVRSSLRSLSSTRILLDTRKFSCYRFVYFVTRVTLLSAVTRAKNYRQREESTNSYRINPRFATGVSQEFFKRAIPDCLIRDTDVFSIG